MHSNDFAGERLGAQSGLAERLDMLPVPLELFQEVALFSCGFVDEARKGTALRLALVRELLVGGRLLVYLTPQCLNLALVRRAAVGEIRMKAANISVMDSTEPEGSMLCSIRTARIAAQPGFEVPANLL